MSRSYQALKVKESEGNKIQVMLWLSKFLLDTTPIPSPQLKGLVRPVNGCVPKEQQASECQYLGQRDVQLQVVFFICWYSKPPIKNRTKLVLFWITLSIVGVHNQNIVA